MGIHLVNGKINYSDPQEQFHIERYRKIASLIKGGSTLDIGSAEGWGAYVLAPVSGKITVTDLDAKVIARARKNFPIHNAEYIQGDTCALPFQDETFDMVAACELIEHLDKTQQEKMIREISRVLKHGGLAIVTTPDRRRNIVRRVGIQYIGHKRELSLSELSQIISRNLSVVSLWGQDIGRKMFFRHIVKRILPFFGKKFDYSKVDFLLHPINVSDKASYIMVIAQKT